MFMYFAQVQDFQGLHSGKVKDNVIIKLKFIEN